MPIKFAVQHLSGSTEAYEFGDEELITFGRSNCDVPFEASDTIVGNRHFAIERTKLGSYSLVLDSTHPVYRIGDDGKQQDLLDWQKNYLLKRDEELMVGTNGPRVKVIISATAVNLDAPTTIDPALGKVEEDRITKGKMKGVTSRVTMIGGAILLVLGMIAFVFTASQKEDKKNRLALAKSKVALEKLRAKSFEERKNAELKNKEEREKLLRKSIEEREKLKRKLQQEAAKKRLEERENAELKNKEEREKLKRKLKEDYEKKLRDNKRAFTKEFTVLKSKSKKMTKQLESLGPEMLSHLKNIGRSVYLVTFSTSEGAESGLATAWVAKTADGEKVLLTNGHVSTFLRQQRKVSISLADKALWKSAKLWAHSPGENSVRLEVTGSITHPGYDKLQDIIREFGGPARKQVTVVGRNAVYRLRGVSFIPGYDVALLTVKDPSKLAPALKIEPSLQAPGNIKEKLTFELVGMAGYPMTERSSLIKNPNLKYRRGFVSGVTNFFYGDLSEHNFLIQHTIATEGGSSGSPVINKSGRVIAIHSSGLRGKADLNYAQCINQAFDLLKARALRDLAARKNFLEDLEQEVDNTWRKVIRNQFESREELSAKSAIIELEKGYKLKSHPELVAVDKKIDLFVVTMRKDVQLYRSVQQTLYNANPRLIRQTIKESTALERKIFTTRANYNKKLERNKSLKSQIAGMKKRIEALHSLIVKTKADDPKAAPEDKPEADPKDNAERVKSLAAKRQEALKEATRDLAQTEHQLIRANTAVTQARLQLTELNEAIKALSVKYQSALSNLKKARSHSIKLKEELKMISARNGKMQRDLYQLRLTRKSKFNKLKGTVSVKIVDSKIEDLVLTVDPKNRISRTQHSFKLTQAGVYYFAAVHTKYYSLKWTIKGLKPGQLKSLNRRSQTRKLFARAEVKKDQPIDIEISTSAPSKDDQIQRVRLMVYRSK
jgi:hypothetical protein